MHPSTNGSQRVRVRPGGLSSSISHPKKIIAAFATKIAPSATKSATPVSIAIRTTITDADSEYSIQRNGLTPAARYRS